MVQNSGRPTGLVDDGLGLRCHRSAYSQTCAQAALTAHRSRSTATCGTPNLNGDKGRAGGNAGAFTLVELLVVIGIVGLLIAILLPSLSRVREQAARTHCLANLRQIGGAIFAYATDYNGSIPYGPKAPLMSPTNFYPRTGNVTSLISLEDGRPVGLGLMLKTELSQTKMSLFCPAADQGSIAEEQLALVGKGQAQCDYYYRHASGGNLYADAGTSHLQLARLGKNSAQKPIRALVIDVNFLTVPGLAGFGGYTRTCHRNETVNILFADGSVRSANNRSNEFTVDTRTELDKAFAKILAVFERADVEY